MHLRPGVSTSYKIYDNQQVHQMVTVLGIFGLLSLSNRVLKHPLDECQQAPRVEPHPACATLGSLHLNQYTS
jgi:hypothetical protein